MRVILTPLTLLLFTTPAFAQSGIVDILNDTVSAAHDHLQDLVGLPGSTPDDPDPPGWSEQAPTLRRGDSGGAVGLLQTLVGDALAAQGLARPAVDNDFGPGTERAVKQVQAQAGQPQTGVVDADTWDALGAALPDHPLGQIAVFGGTAVGPTYKRQNDSSADITPVLIQKKAAPNLVFYESKMSIDADGAGDAWKTDPWGQPETSLRYADGSSLNPSELNFMVLPGGFAKRVPGLRLGDVVAVTYRGRTAYAIYGDVGPRTKIGEGSIHLAETLGINANPKTGGTGGGVLYMVFPGSGDGTPLSQAEIDRRGEQLLRTAGGRT